MKNHTESPRLLPWYVHLFGGWSFGLVFPWFLTCRQFYSQGRKKTTRILMGANLLLFAILFATVTYARYPWDKLLYFAIVTSVVWSFAAWLVQRKVFGAAPKRYYLHEWKNWVSPILIAVFLGIGLSVALSFFPLVSDRMQLYQSHDLLAKKVILWDFFCYVPHSLLFSLSVGIWWAGERNRFSSSHVLSYFFGLIVSYCIAASLAGLYYFLLSRGQFSVNGTEWQVLPQLQGIKRVIYLLISNDYSTYFFMPLLLGTIVRITDFWKRSLAIFPVLIGCLLLTSSSSPRHWQHYQNQIFYEMSSENDAQRDAAYNKAELLLDRFPNHDGWPEIATKVARHRYLHGEYDASRILYELILEKTKGSTRWYRQADLAKAALSTDQFGHGQSTFNLHMKPLRYESYMTSNWMALIRNLRFYEGEEMSELSTLIKLRGISEDDKKIKLSEMPSLAELDDRASSLGYSVLLLHSEISTIEKLIRAGFPVIQPVKNSFYLLSGIDTGRALITGSNYDNILSSLKKVDKEGIADKSPFGKDDESSRNNQPSRADIFASAEIPFSFWLEFHQKDHASLVAVVFPPDQLQHIVSVLGENEPTLQKRSKAYLTALIGLSALNCGDVVQAVTWSQVSYETAKDTFPLHVANLADLLWKSRGTYINSKLHLEKNLPQLQRIDRFLADPQRQAFLKLARTQFNRDLEENRLDWISRQQYKDFLDISNPKDRQALIAITKETLRHEPDSREDRLVLSRLYSWEKDIDNMVLNYKGALEAGPWNNEFALKIAYLSIQQGQYIEAQNQIAKIVPDSVKYEPDYFYCLASLANWKKDFIRAKRYYQKAIEMRRYDSHYSLDYADMLDRLKENQKKAERLRSWVSRLVGSGHADFNDKTAKHPIPHPNEH